MSAESVAESIPTGYKQTEVGVIPEDWNVTTLGDIVIKFIHGGTPSTKNESYWKGDIPWITGADILNQQISEIRRFITADAVKNSSTNIVNKGNLLLVSRTGVGKLAITPCDIAISQDFTGIYTKKDNLSTEYLFRFLDMNQSLLKNQNQGTSILGITRETISSILISFPPTLAEQEAIATALSDTDALIESLEQLIAKKRQIKQGAMQELLTGKRRLTGFSGEWEVKCVGNVLKIAHGRSQHAVENQNGIYPILATGGQIGTANQFLYDKPSVLIGRKGTIDKPRFMDKPFWTVDTLFYSIILEPNNAKFLYYNFCLIDWKQYNEASGVPSLNAHTIEQIVLIVPSPEEQTAIATILSDMDSEITVLEEKLAKTRQIKQGMMQELLTGRIRLV